MTSLAHAVVSRLVQHGVRTVFAIPGTHNLELFRACLDLGVRVVPAHHEQGLGYAADAFARVTEGPAVVVTTTGPGITNLITALATSAAASVPVLAIAPGLPEEHLGQRSGWLHELPDQLGLMGSVVESHRASGVEDAVGFIDEWITATSIARPAPAYLELPLDRLGAAVPALLSSPVVAAGSPSSDHAASVQDAAALLMASERPVLVVGRGGCSGGAPGEVRRIAEMLHAPVLTTANAKGALDERHRLACGVALRTAAGRAMLAESDGVLVIGTDLGPSEFWGPCDLQGSQVVRIDVDADMLHTNTVPAVGLVGRAEELLPGLRASLSSLGVAARDEGRPRGHWAAPHAEAIRTQLERDGAAYRGFHEIMQDEIGACDVVITGDSSQASYFGTASFWSADRPHRFLYPAGYGTLGYAVPAAVGAAEARVADRIIAVTGEGGLLFSVQELATVAELGLPIITVVFSNGGYQEIRDGMDGLGIAPVGVGFPTPDFVALGAAFHLHAESVAADHEGERGFREAFRRALRVGGPALIEVTLPAA